MRQQLRRRLMNLMTGESLAVALFWVDFLVYRKWLVTSGALVAMATALALLSVILIQGAVYWGVLIRRLDQPGFAVPVVGRLYRLLRWLDGLLLAVGLVVLLLSEMRGVLGWLTWALWGFAVIEWVNYFYRRLSYSLNPAVLIRHLRRGTLQKSQIAKEIERSR